MTYSIRPELNVRFVFINLCYRIPGSSSYQRSGSDAILPAVLEIREETEEALLNEIVTSLNPNVPSFKLAPAYCLYLMARYRASTHYRPELTPTERAHRLTLMLERVATLILNVIQVRSYTIPTCLAIFSTHTYQRKFTYYLHLREYFVCDTCPLDGY